MKNQCRKTLAILLTFIVIFVTTGCGSSGKAQDGGAAAGGDAPGYTVDYGKSELYTQEDMDAAVGIIMAEFDTWEGCEMHSITYTDDQTCKDNLDYVNSLGNGETFDQCILFKSNFHSPKEGGGAWEADKEYEDWSWYLARKEGGEWVLLTWGWG